MTGPREKLRGGCESSSVASGPAGAGDLYDGYIAFKGWDGAAAPIGGDDSEALLNLAGKAPPYRLLDIGFGRGELLDWARSRGVETHGVEIIAELVERARARGHTTYGGELSALPTRSFDVIVAIDVLEHLTVDALRDTLAQVGQLLREDGVFIARFPNGHSPFSGLYQNGDLTHVRHLTPGALRQVIAGTRLTIVDTCNLRPKGSGLACIKRAAAYAIRDLIEIVLGYAYFGRRIPMDPNITVIMARDPS